MPVGSWRQCWGAPPAHLRDDERVLTLFAPRFARQRAAFNCDPAPYAMTRAVGLYRSTEGRAFLPCLALPCLALPCLALPCLSLPCLALPCLALPCLALPCLALPCLALPCLALPRP